MKKFLNDFKEFAMKGNVIQLAVGVMIGAAFGKIVTSLVNDIFMPIIGLLLGGFNLNGAFYALDGNSYASIEAAQAAGVGTLNYGMFLQSVIDFIIIAFFIFLFVRLVDKLFGKKEEPKKEARKCDFCKLEVDDEATRCPHCTSELKL
ncbi:MAG: large conductance mechanosensitive channel protein MscL [Christensenellaceae bacterium]|nr:large conductance mechanosensitive channel protein MscL [Christensenellaceae bacterium]